MAEKKKEKLRKVFVISSGIGSMSKIWRQDKDKEINKGKDQRQKKKNKSYNIENCHTNLRKLQWFTCAYC